MTSPTTNMTSSLLVVAMLERRRPLQQPGLEPKRCSLHRKLKRSVGHDELFLSRRVFGANQNPELSSDLVYMRIFSIAVTGSLDLLSEM